MNPLIITSIFFGYVLLACSYTLESIACFSIAIVAYSFDRFIEYAKLQLRTNQFTDGQRAAIDDYNKESDK
ncbi:hypothetical protein [Pseudoalteromonas shioyasakiensis]|uniref:hypothetical protein n=1 Tax=Pseudoalteromonas shioyasakiensis TaxID=1190813 RepID=UPI000782E5A9|nr:hypothetical protein [Pseudoalteromonas shioyasakiensis]